MSARLNTQDLQKFFTRRNKISPLCKRSAFSTTNFCHTSDRRRRPPKHGDFSLRFLRRHTKIGVKRSFDAAAFFSFKWLRSKAGVEQYGESRAAAAAAISMVASSVEPADFARFAAVNATMRRAIDRRCAAADSQSCASSAASSLAPSDTDDCGGSSLGIDAHSRSLSTATATATAATAATAAAATWCVALDGVSERIRQPVGGDAIVVAWLALCVVVSVALIVGSWQFAASGRLAAQFVELARLVVGLVDSAFWLLGCLV